MNICWIIDRDCIPAHDGDPDRIKDVGSVWSSWQAWRAWSSDNVLVYDFSSSQNLVRRGYHQRCNLYIRQDYFSQLGRPNLARVYSGDLDTEFDRQEEVMCMLLAAGSSDIVLLMGFDLAETQSTDAYQRHRNKNYLNAVKRACLGWPDRQWVVVDPPQPPDKSFQDITNLTCDTMDNVLHLLA